MKSLFIFSLALFFAMTTFSQRTPEAFLASIPEPPASPCDNTIEEKERFETKVQELLDQIKEQITNRKEERQEFMDNHEDQMAQNMAAQMGLSQADLAKINGDGEISEADAMKMAEKMMGSQLNMSIGEAMSLSNMSEEGQEAWAESYVAEMMTNAQANPGQGNAGMTRNKEMFDLVAEQKSLTDKLLAQGIKVQKQLKAMNTKDSTERIKLERLLEPLTEELGKINLGEGSTEADWAKALTVRLKMWEHRRTYCLTMTPVLVDILDQYRHSVETNLPDQYRLQEVTDELMKQQTGQELKNVTPDLMAFESLPEFLTLLRDVFRFYPGEKPDNK